MSREGRVHKMIHIFDIITPSSGMVNLDCVSSNYDTMCDVARMEWMLGRVLARNYNLI